MIYVDHLLASTCPGNYSIANRNCTGSDGDAYKTIQAATNIVQKGETVSVRAGNYREGVIPRQNGTFDQRITFKSYEGETAVLDGENSRNYGFKLNGKSFINIEGFEIRGYTNTGIFYQNFGSGAGSPVDYIIIRYNKIHDNFRGILNRGGDYSLIEYNELFNNRRDGITMFWRDTNQDRSLFPIVRYNLTYNSGEPGAEYGDGIHISGSSDGIVEYNIAYSNHDDGIDVSGQSTRYPERIIVRFNAAFKNSMNFWPEGDGNGIKWGTNVGGDHTIHHNLSFDNKRAGFDMDDVNSNWPADRVYNNIAWRNGNHDNNNIKAGFVLRGKVDCSRAVPVINNVGWGNDPEDRNNYNGRGDLFTANCGISEMSNNFWGESIGSGRLSTDSPPGMFQNPDLDINTSFTQTTGDLRTHIPAKWQSIWSQLEDAFSPNPDSPIPLIDAGAVIPGIHCEFAEDSGNADQNDTPCVRWFGSAPDLGVFEWSN